MKQKEQEKSDGNKKLHEHTDNNKRRKKLKLNEMKLTIYNRR
jgi:hypothetical protein